jgi:ADP-ribosyl-[dinitrogen reductase] hydrolase
VNRTSKSHPLEIDIVATPVGGQIGMTLLPGRRDNFGQSGPWERDLYTDLDAILAWRPRSVISFLEEHEFEKFGVPEFADVVMSLPKHLMSWEIIPIPDGEVPDAAFEERWLQTGRQVRTLLGDGERVLLHCRAGLGRTGMIAARILAELGMDPEDAISAVRAARSPNAIENGLQENHVKQVRPIEIGSSKALSGVSKLSDEVMCRFIGSLLGGAIGDALGASFEFLPSAEIRSLLGTPIVREFQEAAPGSLLYPRAPGLPTDDTAMTLALLTTLAQPSPITPAVTHEALCRFLQREGQYGRMFWHGGPGGACVSMLRAAADGAGPFELISNSAGGNGAAMRAHVCGLYADRELVSNLAVMQARLSHGHPGAIAAAQAIALIAHEGFYHGRLVDFLPAEITDPTMIEAWDRAHQSAAYEPGDLPIHLRDVNMAGWNTVSAAHAIAQLYVGDPERAIGLAAGSGRDTDTVASMVGAMLGAVHGWKALPSRWVHRLDGRADLMISAELMFIIAYDALDEQGPMLINAPV